MTYQCQSSSLYQLPQEERCRYVLESCREHDPLFSPLSMHYCSLRENFWISFPLIALLMLVVFDLIGFICEEFFVPAILRLVTKLKIKKTTAATTLVPMANSAGDIITIIVSAGSGESLSISLGTIFGANMIVTTILFAILVLISTKSSSIDLQDTNFEVIILFFALSTVALFICDWANASYFKVALQSFVLFFGYVAVSTIKFNFSSQHPKNEGPLTITQEAELQGRPASARPLEPSESSLNFNFSEGALDKRVESDLNGPIDDPEIFEFQALNSGGNQTESISISKMWTKLTNRLSDFWRNASVFSLVLAVVDSPLRVLIILTIPESIHHMLHPLQQFIFPFSTTALIISSIFFSRFQLYFFSMITWQLGLVVSLCLMSYLIFKYSKDSPDARDKSCLVLCLLSIAGSVYWLKNLAEVFIEAVKVIGLINDISRGLLGATLVAFSTCLPDLIVNTYLALKGFPTMAVVNSFAAQLMNLQLGFGLTCLMVSLRSSNNEGTIKIFNFQKRNSRSDYLTSLTILFALANEIYLLIKLRYINKSKLLKIDGFVGIIIYSSFLIALLTVHPLF